MAIPTVSTERAQTEEALIREHLPLVQYGVAEIARRIPRHVCRDDLESAAMLGLAQAARSFEAERNIDFDKFAMIRIRGALLDELRSKDWASRSVRSASRRMDAVNEQLSVELRRTPSATETAGAMGCSVERIEKIMGDVQRGTVLHYESFVADGHVADLLPDSGPTPLEELVSRERRAYLIDAVVALPERLRHVVVAYFFEERPMQQIADELGVTESRVSQMRGEALNLMFAGITANLDPEMVPEEARPEGRVAVRKAKYNRAVADGTDPRERVGQSRGSLADRLAAA